MEKINIGGLIKTFKKFLETDHKLSSKVVKEINNFIDSGDLSLISSSTMANLSKFSVEINSIYESYTNGKKIDKLFTTIAEDDEQLDKARGKVQQNRISFDKTLLSFCIKKFNDAYEKLRGYEIAKNISVLRGIKINDDLLPYLKKDTNESASALGDYYPADNIPVIKFREFLNFLNKRCIKLYTIVLDYNFLKKSYEQHVLSGIRTEDEEIEFLNSKAINYLKENNIIIKNLTKKDILSYLKKHKMKKEAVEQVVLETNSFAPFFTRQDCCDKLYIKKDSIYYSRKYDPNSNKSDERWFTNKLSLNHQELFEKLINLLIDKIANQNEEIRTVTSDVRTYNFNLCTVDGRNYAYQGENCIDYDIIRILNGILPCNVKRSPLISDYIHSNPFDFIGNIDKDKVTAIFITIWSKSKDGDECYLFTDDNQCYYNPLETRRKMASYDLITKIFSEEDSNKLYSRIEHYNQPGYFFEKVDLKDESVFILPIEPGKCGIFKSDFFYSNLLVFNPFNVTSKNLIKEFLLERTDIPLDVINKQLTKG